MEKMAQMAKDHQDNVKLGEIISKLLHKHDQLSEESLSQDFKHCLQRYRESCLHMPKQYENVTLRPWQSDIMTFLDKPTQRQVIWVVGSQGNEGKTFILHPLPLR